ncbi:MAG TPA: sulfatase, partial [Bacteroidales bacterium]|nr:sulfatase [Bacteroidales bacterium]
VSYLLGYWYLFIFWVLLIAGMIKFYPKLMWLRVIEIRNKLWYSILLFSISLLIIGGGFGVARGLEGKPLRLISANDYVSPKFTPLLLNTPFSVVNTMGHKTLSGKTYFSFSEAEKYYSPLHQFNKNESFKPRNVVIIILESFSSEYVFGHKTEEANFTPFLDSLISQGLLCSNTVANSYNSRDALPAILAGFPSLERIDYMGSRYSTNNFRGLPFLLKQKNYHTSFFHGGHNGTMSFDIFTKAAGIDNYFGFDEFVAARGKSGIDGGWGIYDDCFFQYMAEEMDKFPEPFFSTLFSLSSHDPYPIPKSIRDKFPEGPLPILKSVAYTDYSLRNFFDTIKTKDWFANTLFVIVADHTSQSILPEYKNPKARFAIPLLFYSPGDFELQGEFKGICQQTDIMPSILDYLNYEKSFIAWGNSVFEDDYRFAVNYLGTTYHIIDSTYFLNFDGYKSWAIFDYQKDPMQKYNQCNTGVDIQCFVEPYLKAYIQQYEYRMINNLMADTLLRFSDDNIAEMGVN